MVLALLMISQALCASNGPWPDLAPAPSPTGGGEHDSVVVVAVTDYAELDDIPGATDNADLWLQWFVRTRGVLPEHVHRLYDREAVRETIMEEISAAARELGEDGTLWVLFVTHGAPAASGSDVVLVGQDARRTARSLYARSVARSEVLDIVSGSSSAVVVLDSCFSGKGYGGATLVDDSLAPVIPVAALPSMRAGSRTTVLMAAGDDEFAGPLPGGTRPAFSYLLLGALQGWGDRDNDGSVSTAEAVGWTRGALSLTVTGRRQTPSIAQDEPVFSYPVSRTKSNAPDPLVVAAGLKGGQDRVAAAVELGSVDLASKQAELAEAQAQRAEAERREAERRAALEAAAKAKVAELAEALLVAGSEDWSRAAGLLSSGGDEARQFASLYIEKYADAAVTVNGVSYPVKVPQVEEARSFVAGLEASGESSSARPKGARRVPGLLALGGGVVALSGGGLIEATALGPYRDNCVAYAGSLSGLKECDAAQGTHTFSAVVVGIGLVGVGGVVGAVGLGAAIVPLVDQPGGRLLMSARW